LVLTSFSASVALVTAITGLFAMNVMLRPDQVRRLDGWLPGGGGLDGWLEGARVLRACLPCASRP
jgi:hypothetical protein